MEGKFDSHREFPVFRGLQRPLEILGFQGRYIWWAICVFLGTIIGFCVFYSLFGFILGLVVGTFILGSGSVFIYVRQRKGLHTKSELRGIFIFAHTCNL